MTRAAALLFFAVVLAGCGKYGPPLRAGENGAGVATLDHAADCNDPAHDHEAEAAPQPESAP